MHALISKCIYRKWFNNFSTFNFIFDSHLTALSIQCEYTSHFLSQLINRISAGSVQMVEASPILLSLPILFHSVVIQMYYQSWTLYYMLLISRGMRVLCAWQNNRARYTGNQYGISFYFIILTSIGLTLDFLFILSFIYRYTARPSDHVSPQHCCYLLWIYIILPIAIFNPVWAYSLKYLILFSTSFLSFLKCLSNSNETRDTSFVVMHGEYYRYAIEAHQYKPPVVKVQILHWWSFRFFYWVKLERVRTCKCYSVH